MKNEFTVWFRGEAARRVKEGINRCFTFCLAHFALFQITCEHLTSQVFTSVQHSHLLKRSNCYHLHLSDHLLLKSPIIS